MKMENEADALAAVEKCGLPLQFVPESLRSAEICRAAVEKHGWALQCVPDSLRSAEICRAAIEEDGRAIQFVPESLRSAEICLWAVQQNAEQLEYVPLLLRTAEVCRAAGVSLADVPKIDDIHRRVYDAARRPGALDMTIWHANCGKAHCRAGWVVNLAGEAGAALEEKIDTPAAAALIYQVSDLEMAADPDWYASNAAALDDMARLAGA